MRLQHTFGAPPGKAREFRASRTPIDGNQHRDEPAGVTVARVLATAVTFAQVPHPGRVVMGAADHSTIFGGLVGWRLLTMCRWAGAARRGGFGSRGRLSRAGRCAEGSLAADAACEFPLAWAGQFAYRTTAAGDGHQQRLGWSVDLRACPGGKAEVGGDQPQPADPPQPADIRGDQGGAQGRDQPFGRYGARLAERAADVLVVDECLDQAGPAAQRGGLPPGCR